MPSTFKKLASIAIFFVAVKILVDSGHFQKAANDITHRNPASATSDTETLRHKSSSPTAASPQTSADSLFVPEILFFLSYGIGQTRHFDSPRLSSHSKRVRTELWGFPSARAKKPVKSRLFEPALQ